MTVLIVDDDKSMLLMLGLHLSRAGYKTTSASDSDEALAALKETPFDWLLLDGEIFPIDGFKLSRKAKDMHPNMRIAMLSGIYEPADIKGQPIEKLFQKPLDTHALISYLREPLRT